MCNSACIEIEGGGDRWKVTVKEEKVGKGEQVSGSWEVVGGRATARLGRALSQNVDDVRRIRLKAKARVEHYNKSTHPPSAFSTTSAYTFRSLSNYIGNTFRTVPKIFARLLGHV